MTASAYCLETVGLRKEYPGTVALRNVSLRFHGGKIHALLGKNGAGKSTLVKILAGAIRPTAGIVLVNGTPVDLSTPRHALRQGIAAVHQELSLIPELTVAENLLLGRLPKRRRLIVNWPETFARAHFVLKDLGVTLDIHATAGRLGVAQQQILEIAKAMSHTPAVLMLDEPTSALAQHETERLFELLRNLASRGVVILYITHRLEEIHRIADTVTVLRNGELVGTIGIKEATPATIVHMMFGETIQKTRPPDIVSRRELALEARGFTRTGKFQNVTFSLYKGEILGIAGLLGSGRTELLRCIFGADPHDSGEIVLDGIPISPSGPKQMKALGVVLTPENRKEEGLIQILSTRANICLASLGRIARRGFTTRRRESAVVEKSIRDVSITVLDAEGAVSTLSGGNQQKVVIAKWLNTGPRVILLDEPTRGIDIQAKQQIFQIIWDLSRKGIGCIVVSSELEELMDLCHRILILKKGRVSGEIIPYTTTLEQLVAVCML